MAQTLYSVATAVALSDAVAEFEENFYFGANGNHIDQAVFEAEFACQVTAVSWSHGAAGTDAGAVSLMPKKATGTQDPTQGNALLSAAFDMKAAANTKQTGALTATTADLQLAVGNRITADFTGTITTLAGGLLTIKFKKI